MSKRVFTCLIALLICCVMAVSISAIDTPWLPLAPDSGTSEEATTETPTIEPTTTAPEVESTTEAPTVEEPTVETTEPATEPTTTTPTTEREPTSSSEPTTEPPTPPATENSTEERTEATPTTQAETENAPEKQTSAPETVKGTDAVEDTSADNSNADSVGCGSALQGEFLVLAIVVAAMAAVTTKMNFKENDYETQF